MEGCPPSTTTHNLSNFNKLFEADQHCNAWRCQSDTTSGVCRCGHGSMQEVADAMILDGFRLQTWDMFLPCVACGQMLCAMCDESVRDTHRTSPLYYINSPAQIVFYLSRFFEKGTGCRQQAQCVFEGLCASSSMPVVCCGACTMVNQPHQVEAFVDVGSLPREDVDHFSEELYGCLTTPGGIGQGPCNHRTVVIQATDGDGDNIVAFKTMTTQELTNSLENTDKVKGLFLPALVCICDKGHICFCNTRASYTSELAAGQVANIEGHMARFRPEQSAMVMAVLAKIGALGRTCMREAFWRQIATKDFECRGEKDDFEDDSSQDDDDEDDDFKVNEEGGNDDDDFKVNEDGNGGGKVSPDDRDHDERECLVRKMEAYCTPQVADAQKKWKELLDSSDSDKILAKLIPLASSKDMPPYISGLLNRIIEFYRASCTSTEKDAKGPHGPEVDEESDEESDEEKGDEGFDDEESGEESGEEKGDEDYVPGGSPSADSDECDDMGLPYQQVAEMFIEAIADYPAQVANENIVRSIEEDSTPTDHREITHAHNPFLSDNVRKIIQFMEHDIQTLATKNGRRELEPMLQKPALIISMSQQFWQIVVNHLGINLEANPALKNLLLDDISLWKLLVADLENKKEKELLEAITFLYHLWKTEKVGMPDMMEELIPLVCFQHHGSGDYIRPHAQKFGELVRTWLEDIKADLHQLGPKFKSDPRHCSLFLTSTEQLCVMDICNNEYTCCESCQGAFEKDYPTAINESITAKRQKTGAEV